MNELFQMVLGGRSVSQALTDEARKINEQSQDRREYTFNAKELHGFVTAKSIAVPVEELRSTR